MQIFDRILVFQKGLLATFKFELPKHFWFDWKKKWLEKHNTWIIQQFILGFQNYKCMVLYDMCPFVLACVNTPMD